MTESFFDVIILCAGLATLQAAILAARRNISGMVTGLELNDGTRLDVAGVFIEPGARGEMSILPAVSASSWTKP